MTESEKNKKALVIILLCILILILIIGLVLSVANQESEFKKNQPELFALFSDYRKTVKTSKFIKEKCKTDSVYVKKEFISQNVHYNGFSKKVHNTIFFKQIHDNEVNTQDKEFRKKFKKALEKELFVGMINRFHKDNRITFIWIFHDKVDLIVKSILFEL